MHEPTPTDLDSALALEARLRVRAHARGVPLRALPPAPTTCCSRGCNGCVWESWLQAVAYWRDEALLRLAD